MPDTHVKFSTGARIRKQKRIVSAAGKANSRPGNLRQNRSASFFGALGEAMTAPCNSRFLVSDFVRLTVGPVSGFALPVSTEEVGHEAPQG